MFYTTKGLVLREVQYRDYDKLLSVLTQNLGLITVKARGVRRKNSPLKGGCQLLTYSEFTLYERNGYYTVNEVEPLTLFSGIHSNIEWLSLGAYFAQLIEMVATSDTDDPELLSLCLNSLYALESLKKHQALVKAVFELRLMCMIGFTPMLDGCSCCGAAEASHFLIQEGKLLCDGCRQTSTAEMEKKLPAGVLCAMRHITGCEKQRLFSFTLPQASLQILGDTTEAFLLVQLGQKVPSLDFYKRIFTISI